MHAVQLSSNSELQRCNERERKIKTGEREKQQKRNREREREKERGQERESKIKQENLKRKNNNYVWLMHSLLLGKNNTLLRSYEIEKEKNKEMVK